MLNTSKRYTLPNYCYDYIAIESSKLFYIKDKWVQGNIFFVSKIQIIIC